MAGKGNWRKETGRKAGKDEDGGRGRWRKGEQQEGEGIVGRKSCIVGRLSEGRERCVQGRERREVNNRELLCCRHLMLKRN